MRQLSIGAMLEQLDTLRDLGHLRDSEDEFVTEAMARYTGAGRRTSLLTENQVVGIETLWQEHCDE